MSTSSNLYRPIGPLAAGSVLLLAVLGSQAALAASVIASKHDLTSSGTNSTYTVTVGAEPCAFCHTPHGASASAQLWNRGAPATAAFGLYSSSTMLGSTVQPGPGSLLCLSCHDGATALDLVINKPQSSQYNASGQTASYVWTGATGSNMNAASGANLGTTLANDHPVGINFPNAGTTYKLTVLYSNTAVTAPAAVATSGTGWWLDTGAFSGGTAGNVRTVQDLPLFPPSANAWPRVECPTCHQSHDNANGSFLRVANTGSVICITCHIK